MNSPAGPRPGATPRPVRLVAYTDATASGGAELALGNLLGALDPAMEAWVMGIDGPVLEAVAAHRPGTRVRRLAPVRDKRDLRRAMAHVRAVAEVGPDVLHANLRTPWSCQYGVLAGLAVPGVRTVVVEQLPMPSADARHRRLKRMASARLSAHVSVGEGAARLVERYVGLPSGSVRTIYNGVPDFRSDPAPGAGARRVVGVVARCVPEKGLDVLIRSLRHLPEVRAVVVGDGPDRAALEALAVEIGVADLVEFKGWSSDTRGWLSSFDVFAMPSRFEGLPLALVDAMLAGLPIVSTGVGSIPEAIIDGRTGILVPSDDPAALAAGIGRLLDEPGLARSLGSGARALAAASFTDQAMARAYERLYSELLAERSPPRGRRPREPSSLGSHRL